MSQKIDKKDLKAPDTFVSASDRVFAWVEKHAATVGLVAGVAIVAALAYVGYGYYRAQAEAKAAEALYAPEAELKKAENNVREERAKMMQEMAAKVKIATKPEQVRPVDYAKDFAPAVEKLKEQIKRYGSTRAAMVSAMNLSSFLLQQKQYADALQVLSLTTYQPSHSDILGAFWLMHQGLVNMENQKYDDAAKAYQAVVDSKALAAFHPEAMLKLGVAYELKGEAEKAKQTYEKIGREFPNSEASSSAQQYLRLLELKSSQG